MLTGSPPITPLPFADQMLATAVFVAGALVGIGVAIVARWGVRTARTARAVAEAAGQLVVVRPIDGGPCTPLCVPPKLASLLAPGSLAGDVLPPWRPDVADGVEALRAQVIASPSQSATMEWALRDRRLRLVGARIGDGDQLLVSLAEAGPDVARYNQLESAALLSSGVAHDLINVLNTLVLHAEVGADRAIVEAARTHFDRIRVGSTRASELVSVMRRYLRGERASGAQRVPVDASAIVEEVADLLRPTLARGLDLVLELEPDCVVLAEPVHLHQVALNLLVNASQALDGRAAPRIVASVARDGDAIAIVVADNGPGLPPAVRERLFEPFFTTKATRGGTGLGLAVVRTLVTDALRGSVTADDAPGGGARFTVRLPIATQAAIATLPRSTGEHAVI